LQSFVLRRSGLALACVEMVDGAAQQAIRLTASGSERREWDSRRLCADARHRRPPTGTRCRADWPDRIMQLPPPTTSCEAGRPPPARCVATPGGCRLSEAHYRFRAGAPARGFGDGDWSPALQERAPAALGPRAGHPVPAVVAPRIAGRWAICRASGRGRASGMLALHQAIPLAAAQFEPSAFRL